MNQVIGSVGLEKKQVVKVSIKEWKGGTYVDIRTHYTGTDGQWYPTQKGLFINKDKISELITALEHAEQALHKAGLQPVA